MFKVACFVLIAAFLGGQPIAEAKSMENNSLIGGSSSSVTKEQAIAIAQDYVVKKKIGVRSLTPKAVTSESNRYTSNKHSFYYVEDSKYQDKVIDVWVVCFRCRAPGILPISLTCYVHVDANDGHVLLQNMDTI